MGELKVSNVTKTFKTVTAVDDLNVTFKTGKIYALLGRNGVGKTTLMRLLTTQYIPNKGEITYNGKAVFENEELLSKMCLFCDDMEGFTGLKIAKLIKMAGLFYPNWNQEYCDYLLEKFDLDKKKVYSALSKGQKTSVAIVLGMASGCEITIFDEIYSGLDAVMRKEFYDLLIEEYSENNRTFILSTHLIDEMSNLFTDVVIMEAGKVLVNEEVEKLRSQIISLRGRKEMKEKLNKVQILNESEFASAMTWIVKGNFTNMDLKNYETAGFEVKALSLQEIFVALTGYVRR